jgi:paraquat-inducible protein B
MVPAHRINESGGSIPTAVIQPKRVAWPVTRLWWVTLVAAIGAVVLIAMSLKSSGPVLTIRFADGHGLRAGDLLKYRGIEIGEVTDVVLTPEHDRVSVKVRMEPKAATIARRGSLFWVERPRLSVSRVSGLDTVVGPKYLGVIPGPAGEPAATEFDGLESPPTLNQSESMEITIRFRDGYGLQIGDPVRHRGIAVGEVTAVDLSTELSAVVVRVRLVGEAHRLACEGSQFWIERPRVSIAEVRGLDTLVGGRYVAVLPGTADAKAQTDFDGLDATNHAEVPAGALEIVLYAPQRWGVDRGVAVTYRGLRVGQVLSVALASDGTSIEARAFLEARYRSLVRQNSVFWSNSGVDVNFGLTGFQFSAETLSSIAQGGVAFATPAEPGPGASTGQRFPYQKSPRDEWLTWQPRIAVAEAVLPNSSPLPQSQRAVARWAERSFGIRRNRERSGWILKLGNGLLLGPADLLMATDLAANSVVLEFAGSEFPVSTATTQQLGSLATFRPSKLDSDEAIAFPTSRIRPQASPEDCLIVTDAQSEPVPITASSLLQRDGGWEIRGTKGLTPDHHGATVVSVKDGQLIGQLVFHRGKATIATIERVPE